MSEAARKAALLLFSVAVLLAGVAAGRGQSALDGFDPNANNYVRAVVVQPDGKILIGGDFTTLSPNGGVAVTRNRIARLNPDGTLDTAFNPNANSTVLSIAVQADGKILVGGNFTSIGGHSRNRIARLDATTGLADSFNPNANGAGFPYVHSIAVQADGKILAGGLFNNIGGQTRNRIARLDATTGLADSFNPNANDVVYSIAVQADGKILAGGGFTSIGGQTRNCIARLDATTGLADSFDPNAGNSQVDSIAVQADGKILAGGYFNFVGGATRNHIARLDAATGQADSFNPNANDAVLAISVQADGKILAGGLFNSIGGQTRNFIARLDATTGLADSFNPNASAIREVLSIAVQADGKILAGGYFTSIDGHPRDHIARLEIDGTLDQTLNLSAVGDFILATAIQPDGKILIGGRFTSLLGVARLNLARLNTDGTLDAAFNPNPNESVYTIAVQPDGKILVGGFFSGANSIGGQTRNRIARLDGTTGLADSFDPNASNAVFAVAAQADGRILACGYFSSIGGQPRNYIARLDAVTGLADSFDPNANGFVHSIAVQADGKILVGGEFTNIGGQPRGYMARLDATTGLADSFNPNADFELFSIVVQPDDRILAAGFFTSIGGQLRTGIARLDPVTGVADPFNAHVSMFGHVRTIAVQADGKILAGGEFTSIGGQARHRIGRLDPITGLADLFNPNAVQTVDSIAVQADGRVLAGGAFTTIGEQRRRLFARLTNDTVPVQDLAVTQSTITWTRGGSSPQFWRVTFEYSNDNLTFAFLGNGTAAGSNWILTGLNLPTGQNFYIRARGYYRSGFENGSESIAESVRNAFIAGPSPTPTPTPTPTPPPSPTPTIPPSPTPTSTSTPTLTPMPAAQAINISTRMRVQTNDNVGIGGFIVTGTAPMHVLLRAIGPSLAQFGVPNVLADPVLELHDPSGLVTTINDNWRDDPVQEALVIASGIPPTNNLESAIDATLLPGAYTAVVRGKNNTSGVGLVEVYDLNQAVDSKLANISTRAFVSTGDNIVIAGFILGNHSGDDRIIVRGIGPSLTVFGVPNALQDPTLELRDSNGALIAANNDWQDNMAQAAELTAAGLAPANPLESGIAAILPPGFYTALLAGLNNGTGVGLVEAYDRGNESGGPRPSPTPAGTPTPTPSPTATVGPTATVAPTATIAPSGTPTPTLTPMPSATPTATPSGTPTPIPTPSPVCVLFQGFDDITTLPWVGWAQINHSSAVGTNGWFQGNSAVFPAQSGAATSYIAANFDNQGGAHTVNHPLLAPPLTVQPEAPSTPTPTPTPGAVNTISNWLLTPPLTLQNGAMMTFYTRTVDVPQFPDRLQVRMSINGASTNVGTTSFDVGDFTTLLLDINPTYTPSGYPNVWTQFTVTVSGIGLSTTGRLAFRYFVENGGPSGTNSDYIGIDSAVFYCTTPTPTPTPSATPTPSSAPGRGGTLVSGTTPTPTLTPTPAPAATPTPTATPPATPSPPPTPRPTITPNPCSILYFTEHFDSVTAPALPSDFVTSFTPGPANCTTGGTCALGTNWVTTTTTPDTSPNCAFHDAPGCVTDSNLDTPSIFYGGPSGTSSGAFLTFAHSYDLESGFDGAVLEISINGGPFTDIVAAGGTFLLGGGYNGIISTGSQSPLAGRPAFTGNSGGYLRPLVSMPAAAVDQNVRFRFRLATDCSGAGTGWRIDSIDLEYLTGCAPTPRPTPTPSPSPTPTTKAINLSTRMRVGTGDNVGIGGFIVTGSAPKRVLLRGIGPSLAASGITDALADPILDLRASNGLRVSANDNWRDTQAAEIEATGIPPPNNLESAIVITLLPGSYTAILTGKFQGTGIGLVEIYDLNQGVNSKLANLSTRAFVSPGDSIVIAGFILGGSNANDRIVVRGIGPSLTALGVSNALANPTLELRDSNGGLLAMNNNWQDNPAQASELTAAGLAPTNQLESGIAMTLSPGLYTALLAGVNNGTGVGLVEVYDRGAP